MHRLVLTLGLLAAGALVAAQSPRDELLKGVKEIAAPGIPGSVSAYSASATVILAGTLEGRVEAPVAVAVTFGKGRAVGLGHDGYFGDEALRTADTARFLENAVRWLAAGKASPRLGIVGAPSLASGMKARGLDAREVGLDVDLGSLDVVALTHPDLTPAQTARLREFVRNGGGLLSASTGWGWQMITQRGFANHPINRVLQGSGLFFSDGMLNRTSATGFTATRVPDPLSHAGSALSQLTSRRALNDDEKSQAVASVLQVGVNLPADDATFRPRLRALRESVKETVAPSAASPVTLKDPLRRIALALDTAEAQSAPVAQVRAHPAGAIFPGAVPTDAKPVRRTVRLDGRQTGWISLGLYAAPGDRVTVQVPPSAAAKGYAVRIGAHTDELWGNGQWRRAPSVSRRFAINQEVTVAANAFGGLVYLEVPDQPLSQPFEATVVGAVEAPLFELGKTNLADWRNRIRHLPGPWAEVASGKLIVTVPSSEVRALDDPEALMRFWDRVMDACADLVSWPHGRRRPERIVADEQISVGYMHAGYPIMTHLDAANLSVNLGKLKTEGSWGHFHEIGHNHQSDLWTFDGTVEVTVNLFTMYVYATVLGQTFDQGHPAIRDRAARLERVRKYVADGARFQQWQSDPFLALTMYIQVIDQFGWDAIKGAIRSYRDLPAADRPRTEEQKRDRWLIQLSRQVGRDLGGFFHVWGVPTSESARAQVASLPDWMPDEMKNIAENRG